MKDLVIHCGGKFATYDDLVNVPVPPETDTYKPLPYGMFVDLAREIVDARVGDDFHIHDQAFGLNSSANRMFGVLRYRNGNPDVGLAIGLRTSYDKSMSTGICMGGSVFVCDNLVFSGDITIMRRHTGKLMMDQIVNEMSAAVWEATATFRDLENDIKILKTITIENAMADHVLNTLFFREGCLNDSQFKKAYQNWDHPPQPEFEPRTMWSLYNAINDSLKSTDARAIFEKHRALHGVVMGKAMELTTTDGGIVTASLAPLAV